MTPIAAPATVTQTNSICLAPPVSALLPKRGVHAHVSAVADIMNGSDHVMVRARDCTFISRDVMEGNVKWCSSMI